MQGFYVKEGRTENNQCASKGREISAAESTQWYEAHLYCTSQRFQNKHCSFPYTAETSHFSDNSERLTIYWVKYTLHKINFVALVPEQSTVFSQQNILSLIKMLDLLTAYGTTSSNCADNTRLYSQTHN